MTAPTYGELIDGASIALARAAAVPMRLHTVDDVRRLAAGLECTRRAIAHHVALATDPWALGSTTSAAAVSPTARDLATALSSRWLPADDRVDTMGAAPWWADAARRIGAAGDLVATHIGPTGRWLTADAQAFASPEGREQLVRDAAGLADTVAAVAIRASGDVTMAGDLADSVATVWFGQGRQVAAAASRVLGGRGGAAQEARLDNIAIAPLLRGAPVRTADDVVDAFDRLRRFSHAQRYGDVPASAATLRGYAALGYASTGHGWIAHQRAAESSPRSARALPELVHEASGRAMREANVRWGALHDVLDGVRDAEPVAGGWHRDFAGVRDALARLASRGSGDVARLADHMAPHLGRLADDQLHVARRLYRQGALQVPTVQLEDGDVPRPYAPMPAARFERITRAYAESHVHSQALAERVGQRRTVSVALGGMGQTQEAVISR